MVVDNVLTIFIVGTTQDSVSEWVTICFNFSTIVKEMLLVLRSIDTIKHDIQIPWRWVLQANWHINTWSYKAVFLVLNRTCSNSVVAKQIIKEGKIWRIKHLVSDGKTCFSNNTWLKVANRLNPSKKVYITLCIWLVDKPLITISISTWFSCINTHNNKDFVLHFFLKFGQTVSIVKNGFFIIRWTWTNNQEKTFVLTLDNFCQGLIISLFSY